VADHYQILGVSKLATSECIRKAFRAKAKKMHPDVNPDVSPEEFLRINEAYRVLSDETRRRLYDLRLKHGIIGQRVYYRPGNVGAAYRAQYQHAKKPANDEMPKILEKILNYFLFISLILASLFAVFLGIYRLFQEPIEGVNPYHGLVVGVVLAGLMTVAYLTYIKASKS